MSLASRIEIEARLFVFMCLDEMKQAGQLVQAAADRPRLLADLLHLYPLVNACILLALPGIW